MLYLLWGLLNMAIIVLIAIANFKVLRLLFLYLKDKIGPIVSIFFIVGLLSFFGRLLNTSNDRASASDESKIVRFDLKDTLAANPVFDLHKELENNWVFSLELFVKYGIENEHNQYFPVQAFSEQLGVISGLYWRQEKIVVNRTTDNKMFEYNVAGTLKWQLVGFTIFYQHKAFSGFMKLK